MARTLTDELHEQNLQFRRVIRDQNHRINVLEAENDALRDANDHGGLKIEALYMEVERLTGIIGKASAALDGAEKPAQDTEEVLIPSDYRSARVFMFEVGRKYSVAGLSRSAGSICRRESTPVYTDAYGEKMYPRDVLSRASVNCTALAIIL